ncbi:hypothetical protein L1887_15408 [Cichorium endivia]|nr:hypothetical protein L1887_15408 [Cichorium endivia]
MFVRSFRCACWKFRGKSHLSLYMVEFIEVLTPHNKSAPQWHHHHLLLPLQPFLLGHASTMFFLALEEKILAKLLWTIFTRLLNKKVSTRTRMTKHFPEANPSTHPL